MKNIYEKSLELMDAHFESISDEEFMHSYLSVEENKGPLVKDLLSDFYSYNDSREIKSEIGASVTTAETLHELNIDCFVEELVEFKSNAVEPTIIKTLAVSSVSFELSYVANDEYHCDLSLVA